MFSFTLNEKDILKQIDSVERSLYTTVQDVEIPRYFQQLQRIAGEAAELARIQIKLATTKTGRARAAGGKGEAGRIVNKDFYDNFKWKATRVGKGEYVIRMGWLDEKPDYAKYQEFGFTHRSGMYVTGADALGAAKRYFELELEKLRKQ